MLLLHKNGLFDSSIGIFNDAQILFDEIKRQGHRMQTKLPLVMLENLTQTVWTRRRYQQSYNVAKCLYNLFVFFFVIFETVSKKSDDHGRANQTIAQISNSVCSLSISRFCCFFSFNSIFSSFFYSENIAKFEQFSLV